MASRSQAGIGVLYALAAYGTWGLTPLFWKQLAAVPAAEILAQRVVWAMIVFFGLLLLRGRWPELRRGFRDPKMRWVFLISASMIGINWFLYVWAVNHDQILQASLGYFVSPLFNVVLGLLFLRERLRPWQWLAVILAALGVGRLAMQAETFPWIALVLVLTFGFYALVRKTAPADALLGSNFETAYLLPLGILYLGWLGHRGEAVSLNMGWSGLPLLIGTGLITALPLLWFSNAARRLPLTTLGFFQYIAPTGQFLCAVVIYGEPFSKIQFQSFLAVWLGLLIFSLEAWAKQRGRGAGG